MSRPILFVVGLVLATMGVFGLVPSWTMVTEPVWHALVKIVIGLIALIVAIVDKPKEQNNI